MEHYAGIDVSLECSSVCIVDATGKIVREGKVGSEPEALIAWFGSLRLDLARVGLEAGPLSQWLYAAMQRGRLAVELLETRHVRGIRDDAGEVGSQRCTRDRAADAARLVPAGALQIARRPGDARAADGAQAGAIEAARRREQPARDIARLRAEGWGRQPPHFCRRITELVAGHPNLEVDRRGAARRPCRPAARVQGLEKRVRQDRAFGPPAKLLMTTPASGRSWRSPMPVRSTIRRASNPRRRQDRISGSPRRSTNPARPISAAASARSAMPRCARRSIEAAHIMLTKPLKGCTQLKSWAMRIARRAGMRKAKVALARKLAVIMHRMLADRQPFNPTATATTCRCRLRRSINRIFGRATTPGSPRSEVPSPGRWIRSGRHAGSRLTDHASVDWPTGPPRTPSGDGLSADPVQKQVPGEWMTQKGID